MVFTFKTRHGRSIRDHGKPRNRRCRAGLARRVPPWPRLLAVVMGVWHCTGPAAQAFESPPPLPTVAEIKALSGPDFNVQRPLALEGVVTLADEARNLLIVQDETGAIALQPNPEIPLARPGQRVRIEAADSAPFRLTYPRYPFDPTQRDILPTLDLPAYRGRYCLTRLRGWVRAPATGAYTFWIASDNSSQLWLSPGADPTQARRIAGVQSGDWTGPYEWNRFPSQRSEPHWLEENALYYIDALHERQGGAIHLAVAWSGPDMDQTIIGAEHLIAWSDERSTEPNASPGARGVLREYWDGFSVASLAPITGASPAEAGVMARDMAITVMDAAPWPDPEPIELEQVLSLENQFRWVEGEANVSFIARDDESLNLELAALGLRPLLRVEHWPDALPYSQMGLRVRFRGVCEAGRDINGRFVATRITVPSPDLVEFFETPDFELRASARANWAPPSPIAPAVGGYFFTRGVVTFSGEAFGRQRLYVQEAFGGIHVEMGAFPLQVPLEVGHKVEIGGALAPGQHTPGIRPRAINVLGWQSLPIARHLSGGRMPQSVRDGLWVEAEGIGRFVHDDGTVQLTAPQHSVKVWIGATTAEDLDACINARIKARGVLALDILDAPVLLVPSRKFVQVIMPAPPLPDVPQPLDGLDPLLNEDLWNHQAKVQGVVTYQSDHHFYLQEGDAAIRVDHRLTTGPQLGETVEVIGFPETDGAGVVLADARWRPLHHLLDLAPLRLDLQRLDPSAHGRLVRIEALLSAQKTRDGDQILELRSDEQVFEATLASGTQTAHALVSGSVLQVTGVCIIETSESGQPGATAMAPLRILLRRPDDVLLLQGPPWWTWERMTFLVALLLAVLLVALLTLVFLSRRFSRQQEARLAFSREILASQESERRRIAASLHDSLGQDLLVIRNQVNRALRTANDHAHLRQCLEDMSNTTLVAINSVREITHNLRPYQIDRLGLTQAIQTLVRKVSDHSAMEFACRVDDMDERFDKDTEMHIYRAIQEGLNNIVKHSDATEATIVVRAGKERLSISIRDNGRGLPAGAATCNRGLGLRSIQERVSLLRGAMKIDSQPGQGLSLQIEIPFPMANR